MILKYVREFAVSLAMKIIVSYAFPSNLPGVNYELLALPVRLKSLIFAIDIGSNHFSVPQWDPIVKK